MKIKNNSKSIRFLNPLGRLIVFPVGMDAEVTVPEYEALMKIAAFKNFVDAGVLTVKGKRKAKPKKQDEEE